ncbi:hypothetical protein [Paenibacillus herberti]|nr:hypothetical protein [Paenibacillus herberti]
MTRMANGYYALTNLGMSLLDLLPLVKLDGYWILSHGLGIANLRTKAFRAVFQLLRFPGARLAEATRPVNHRERSILLSYGLAAVLFTPCFWL